VARVVRTLSYLVVVAAVASAAVLADRAWRQEQRLHTHEALWAASAATVLGARRADERAARLRHTLALRGASSRLTAALLERPSDTELELALLERRLVAGETASMRARTWEGAATNADARDRFMRLWYRSWERELGVEYDAVRAVESDVEVSRVRTFDVASSVMLRFYDAEGEIVGLLKPEQTNPWTNYRGEIATYRLCPLIHCAVDVPSNREVRIEQEQLAELMRLDLRAVRNIERNDYEPIWREGDDGKLWLHGTLKAWVPGFVYFPIEQVDAWRHLVSIETPLERLAELDLERELRSLGDTRREWWPRFLRRAQGVTAFEFAHQLSDLHVLDVLSNNWDRYSSLTPGSNCMFDDGRFLSIDNGATFHSLEERPGRDVFVRLRRIQRFSRTTIDAVRWMETDALFPILFPPRPWVDGDDARWEAFLERRRQLLEHVDDLIDRHGEDEVLAFP